MAWAVRRERGHQPPQDVIQAAIEGHERLLASTRIGDDGPWALATSFGLAHVAPDGILAWRRPWHDVDAASWARDSSTLTVTWIDRAAPVVWALADERLFLQVVRERVQASVVLVEDVPLPGRRTVRAVLRQDLSSGALFEQVVPGRGFRLGDSDGILAPEAQAAVAQAFSRLREQVGMPPRGTGPVV
jgi:hypothetical protein